MEATKIIYTVTLYYQHVGWIQARNNEINEVNTPSHAESHTNLLLQEDPDTNVVFFLLLFQLYNVISLKNPAVLQ